MKPIFVKILCWVLGIGTVGYVGLTIVKSIPSLSPLVGAVPFVGKIPTPVIEPLAEAVYDCSWTYAKTEPVRISDAPESEGSYPRWECVAKNPGSKGEGIGCPHLNSGLFTTVHAQGDVNGIFCGHDHDNDFAVGYKNILLAYGRYSGGNTVYNHLKPSGARIIVLKQDKNDFDTWIRLADGKVIHKVNFPGDFYKGKK